MHLITYAHRYIPLLILALLFKTQPQSGLIWHYTAGTWNKFETTTRPLLSLALSQANDGWAAGYGGVLMHYNGQTWSEISSSTQTN